MSSPRETVWSICNNSARKLKNKEEVVKTELLDQ